MTKLHSNSWIPDKKLPNGKLSVISALWNKASSKLRVSIEHIFAKIKAFKILDIKYRCRLQRYNRTFRIIAGLVNLEMGRPGALKRWEDSHRQRIKNSCALLWEAEKLIDAVLQTA
jgi:hypothetical protein